MTSKRSLTLIVVCMLALALNASAAIPVGTKVTVRLGQAISSESAHTGDTWQGTLANDIVVNGQTIARAGDAVKGKVTYAKSSGRLKTPGQVTIRLTEVNGISVTSSAVGAKGKSHTKSNATKIGGGAAAGALIGGLAGGGKGALIGAGVGAGAGTGVAAATGKQDVTLSAETARTFTITSSK